MARTRAFTVAALCAVGAVGCRSPKGSEARTVVPELKLEGVRFRVYREDTLRAFGVAEIATLRRDSSIVHAEQLEAIVPRGTAPLRLTAPAGEGSLVSRVFEVSGGILATRGDDAARTERARYEPGEDGGIVRGQDPVVLEGPGYRMEGPGFVLDPSAGTIVMSGGARLIAGLPRTAP
jgi:lipopolysaccharide export system protein LptC